jgi:glutamyl-tRNA synthetase
LLALRGVVDGVATWQAEPLEAAFKAWVESSGLTMKDVAQPARVALTGRTASPPLFEVMEVLGKTKSLARLAKAAEIAQG